MRMETFYPSSASLASFELHNSSLFSPPPQLSANLAHLLAAPEALACSNVLSTDKIPLSFRLFHLSGILSSLPICFEPPSLSTSLNPTFKTFLYGLAYSCLWHQTGYSACDMKTFCIKISCGVIASEPHSGKKKEMKTEANHAKYCK